MADTSVKRITIKFLKEIEAIILMNNEIGHS